MLFYKLSKAGRGGPEMALGKKQRDARPSGVQQSTLERFQGMIRRIVSKDDDRSSLVDDIACVVGSEILEGLRRLENGEYHDLDFGRCRYYWYKRTPRAVAAPAPAPALPGPGAK